MVVPVSGGDPGRSPEPGGPSGKESLKPKIISELMKKSGAGDPATTTPPRCGRPAVKLPLDSPSECPDGDRPRMCGVLHCARSEWSPRWEPRYVRVTHGSLEVYLTEEGVSAPPATGARPRRRLPLRNLSLRRVPRRQHAFAICPRETNASPLLLCQANDGESFSRWTRTLAVELMKQTPLGDVRFLDILRITEPPHPDDADEQNGLDSHQSPGECHTDEVERLKELCQRGSATVHERRQLFEALGGTCNGGTYEPRKNLSSSRPCASSEDLGQQPPCKSVARSRAKRAKSLHDLPSDFPVSCALEGGPPISVVSQLRLFFERIGKKGEESVDEPREERKDPDYKDGHSVLGGGILTTATKGQSKKTARSQSYTCESTQNQNLVRSSFASCGRDNVFLSSSYQKLGLGKDTVQGVGCRKDLTSDKKPLPDMFSMANEDCEKKDVNMNSYSKTDSCNGKHDDVKFDRVMRTENIAQAANVTVSNNNHQSSLSHSLSSESLTSSHLPSVPSPSSSCSSLSLNYSTPSTSPHSHTLSQHHYILSVIKKQAAEVEENIWSLQEEMARLDRERMAAQNDKKIIRKSSTPKRTYSELEAQLQQEESKLDKLYKEAERVLKLIERSVKHDAVLASMNQYQMDNKWGELNNTQKFNLRSLTS